MKALNDLKFTTTPKNEPFSQHQRHLKSLKASSIAILKKYFTKLHNTCYNSLHKLLFIIMTPEAERFNGWAAMLGFVAAVGAYVTTGQIIPGWF